MSADGGRNSRNSLDERSAARLLEAIRKAQAEFIAGGPAHSVFDELLADLLDLTRSEYGFIGEVLRGETGDPFLKTHAITNIAWNEETRVFYAANAPEGLRFYNLDTLFGAVMTSRQPVISDDPATDPRSGGLPEGHPRLRTFLGLPFFHRGELIGMVGLANRWGGYDTALVESLAPFLATCSSLIEAHRNVEQRRRAEAELRRTSGLLEELIRAAPLAVISADREGSVLTWNPAAERIFGWQAKEVVGRPNPIIPAQKADEYAAVISGQRLVHFETVRRRKDGSSIAVEVTAAPFFDAEGRHAGAIALIADLSDRERAVEVRRQLEDQLRRSQRIESLGRVAGGIAHDFNNLLVPIHGYAELALGELPEDHALVEPLREILDASERAALLARQLLAFGRNQVIELHTLDLNERLEQFEPMLRRLLRENIQIEIDRAPGLGSIRADATQLDQVMLNLAVNAQDAMPEGGVLRIETAEATIDPHESFDRGVIRPGPAIVLRLADTGAGIAPEILDMLFEPFFTTKERGRGTGIGLATVDGIVRQHEGAIRVDTAPGRGTTFSIYFPRAEAVAEARPPATRVREVRGSETILLVEDSPQVRLFMRRGLEVAGYVVLEAADAEKALVLARHHSGPIQLLVSDVVLPGMSGPQLVDRLAASFPALKVLYVSGYTDDLISPKGVLEPGLYFLQKPFSLRILTQKIRELLDT